MFNLGFGEILVICVVLILVVGPERLPSLMKTMGKAVRTVREASREIQTTVGLDELLRDEPAYRPPQRPLAPPPGTIVSREDLPAPLPADAHAPPLPAGLPSHVGPATADAPGPQPSSAAAPAPEGGKGEA